MAPLHSRRSSVLHIQRREDGNRKGSKVNSVSILERFLTQNSTAEKPEATLKFTNLSHTGSRNHGRSLKFMQWATQHKTSPRGRNDQFCCRNHPIMVDSSSVTFLPSIYKGKFTNQSFFFFFLFIFGINSDWERSVNKIY